MITKNCKFVYTNIQKMNMFKRLFALLLFLISFSCIATHNRGGEIVYKRIAPYTATVGNIVSPVYTYSITLIKYTDHGPSIADKCEDTLYFGDGQKGIAP